MQHYVADFHFLNQEASITAKYHHYGQYQLDCVNPKHMKGALIHNEGKNAMENSQIKRKGQIALGLQSEKKIAIH